MYMLFHELIISIFYFSEYKIQISVLGELRKISLAKLQNCI